VHFIMRIIIRLYFYYKNNWGLIFIHKISDRNRDFILFERKILWNLFSQIVCGPENIQPEGRLMLIATLNIWFCESHFYMSQGYTIFIISKHISLYQTFKKVIQNYFIKCIYLIVSNKLLNKLLTYLYLSLVWIKFSITRMLSN
jgi:hypothetical protein